MNKFSKYVGLDTHAETIAVSVAEALGGRPRYYGEILNRPASVAKLVRQLSVAVMKPARCKQNVIEYWLMVSTTGKIIKRL